MLINCFARGKKISISTLPRKCYLYVNSAAVYTLILEGGILDSIFVSSYKVTFQLSHVHWLLFYKSRIELKLFDHEMIHK